MVTSRQSFNPRGPCGPRPERTTESKLEPMVFQSSRSLRTATRNLPQHHYHSWRVSILAVLADRDLGVSSAFFTRMRFQSSRSLRTATMVVASFWPTRICFNPRGPCGPRPTLGKSTEGTDTVSILAVLADRDLSDLTVYKTVKVSILAVLADRDHDYFTSCLPSPQFQSSRSLRTATLNQCGGRERCQGFQSSRSLRTATAPAPDAVVALKVSILAVLADRDLESSLFNRPKTEFQSSRSLRTATRQIAPAVQNIKVSILAVLADRDGTSAPAFLMAV